MQITREFNGIKMIIELTGEECAELRRLDRIQTAKDILICAEDDVVPEDFERMMNDEAALEEFYDDFEEHLNEDVGELEREVLQKYVRFC